jgi:hypothetical protein
MSTEVMPELEAGEGLAELTDLGKRLEILRIERGVSKQSLARRARTSRQQLWRVMTGKSDLTSSLRDRLAIALGIEAAALLGGVRSAAHSHAGSVTSTPPTVTEYLNDVGHLAATFQTMPAGDGGRRLKRALLNALEDLALESGHSRPIDYSQIHRRVLSGEL